MQINTVTIYSLGTPSPAIYKRMMENFTCAKPVRGSGATREPTGQIWIYDYAVPVCKKGRPNWGGPSEEGKRPAGDDGRSHSKTSKPLRCCDTRHSNRHGTRSSCGAFYADHSISCWSGL